MAVYTLTGFGVQLLTAGTSQLFVLVTTLPPSYSIGRAQPGNLYDVGLLRVAVDNYWLPTVPIDADQQLLLLPAGATALGYNLFDSTAVTVSEGSPPPPTGTSVTTNFDGQTLSPGQTVVFTFQRADTPTVNDWCGLVDADWNISFGDSFVYLSAGGVYTSSNGSTPGTTPVQSGQVSGVAHTPGSVTALPTLHSVYVDGTAGVLLAEGPAITYTGP